MTLPPLPQNFPPYFGNGIATNQLQKKNFPSYFGNAIATIPFHFFFFFFKEMISAHNFYNIFLQQILSGKLLLLD